MLQIFITFLKKYLIKLLQKENFREELIRLVNENVNIPGIDENSEEQVYTALFDVIEQSVLLF